jgi:hypothetical protein
MCLCPILLCPSISPGTHLIDTAPLCPSPSSPLAPQLGRPYDTHMRHTHMHAYAYLPCASHINTHVHGIYTHARFHTHTQTHIWCTRRLINQGSRCSAVCGHYIYYKRERKRQQLFVYFFDPKYRLVSANEQDGILR